MTNIEVGKLGDLELLELMRQITDEIQLRMMQSAGKLEDDGK